VNSFEAWEPLLALETSEEILASTDEVRCRQSLTGTLQPVIVLSN
jgi:hypothetical protein